LKQKKKTKSNKAENDGEALLNIVLERQGEEVLVRFQGFTRYTTMGAFVKLDTELYSSSKSQK